MDSKLYDQWRTEVLAQVNLDHERGGAMRDFVAALVRYINHSAGKTWSVCELGTADNGRFQHGEPSIVDRTKLPFALQITFANKDSSGGRSYGPEFRISVPFIIEWKGHFYELTCVQTGATIPMGTPELREQHILQEASELLDAPINEAINRYVGRT